MMNSYPTLLTCMDVKKGTIISPYACGRQTEAITKEMGKPYEKLEKRRWTFRLADINCA